MTNVVSYKAQQANASPQWRAYVVLPNKALWMVAGEGQTEAEAIGKITSLYEKEKARFAAVNSAPDTIGKPKAKGKRGAHFKGMVWVLHTQTREKKRVSEKEAKKLLAKGWQRGGPRSK